MKRIAMMLGFGIFIFGSIAVVWQWDDELTPDVLKFIELADLHVEQGSLVSEHHDNQAYFYLLGMDADPEDDPEAIGRQRYADQHSDKDESGARNSTPQLALFTVEPDCNLAETTCLDRLVTQKKQIIETIDDYAVMLSRYQQFMAFERYRMITLPSVEEQWPSYSYVINGNRLFLHHVLYQMPTYNVDSLVDNIHRIRHRLANADSLIDKMVFLAMLDESITVLAYVQESNLQKNDTQKNKVAKPAIRLAALSMAERSLSRAMARECAGMFSLNMSLANRADLFAPSPDVPLWFTRIAYKPHMTINDAFPYYQEVAKRSEFTATTFEEEMNRSESEEDSGAFLVAMSDWVRNPVGSVLNGIAAPNYDDYIAKFFALDKKIAAFNQHD